MKGGWRVADGENEHVGRWGREMCGDPQPRTHEIGST